MSYKKFWILNILLFLYARQGYSVFLWIEKKLGTIASDLLQQGDVELANRYYYLILTILLTHIGIYMLAKCYILMKRLEALGISKKLAFLGLGIPLSFGFDLYLLFKTKKYESDPSPKN